MTVMTRSQTRQVAWTFLDDRGDVSDSITYKVTCSRFSAAYLLNHATVLCLRQGLDDATSALATQLRTTHGIAAGDRVLLVFFPGLDFTISVVACFKAGIIAVPVFPPE